MFDPGKGFAGQVARLEQGKDASNHNTRGSFARSASVLFEILAEESNDPQKAQERLDKAAQQHQAHGGDLEREKAALDEHLLHFTPESILKELLGDLFIHPSSLKYTKQLGEGAFATVRLAKLMPQNGDPKLSHTGPCVAVKQLKPEVLKEANDLKDFLMEVNVMRKLRHNNIVAIHGIGASDLTSLDGMRGTMYVVMEAMSGGNLKLLVIKQMMQATPMYLPYDALRWSMQISSAMNYLHNICRPMIIHRDLKLENLLLTDGPISERVAKLADFGLHKRARLNKKTGQLTTPVTFSTQEDYEKSYYGGGFFFNNPSTHRGNMNPSVRGSLNPSVHLSSINPSVRKTSGVFATPAGPVTSPSNANNLQNQRGTTAESSTVQPVEPASTDSAVQPHLNDQQQGQQGANNVQDGSWAERASLLPGYLNSSQHPRNGPQEASPPPSNNNTQHPRANNPSVHKGQHNPSTHGGMKRNASLKSMVAAAATQGSRAQDASTHGGMQATSPNSTAHGEAHGGNAAMAALAASGHKPSPQPPLNAQDNAPHSLLAYSSEPEAARNADHGDENGELPMGWSTLLNDPAQRGNLESLHQLIAEDGKPAAESAQQAADNESVHRKMLALMALDRKSMLPPAKPQQEGAQQGGPRAALSVRPAAQEPAGGMVSIPEDYGRGSLDVDSGSCMRSTPQATQESNWKQQQSLPDTHSRPSSAMNGEAGKPFDAQKPGSPSHLGGLMNFNNTFNKISKPGGSKRAGTAGLKKVNLNPEFTDATQQVGSLMYMSPELVKGHHYNEKVDVFSFAIIMFELFAGRMLALNSEFFAGGEDAVMAYVNRRSAGKRETFPSHWPVELKALIADCWEQEPAMRPDFGGVYRRLKDMQATGALDSMHLEAKKRAASSGCCIIS